MFGFSVTKIDFEKLTNLKVFGCLCYVFTFVSHGSKFYIHERKCVCLGYKLGTKRYLLYDIQNK